MRIHKKIRYTEDSKNLLSISFLHDNLQRYVRFVLLTAFGFAIVFLIQIKFDIFIEVSLIIFVLMVLLVLYSPMKGFSVFVFFAILSDTHYLYSFEGFKSIFTVKLLDLSLTDIVVLILLLRCFVDMLFKGKHKFKVSSWDRTFVTITSLFVLSAAYGLINTPKFQFWIVDVKLFGFFVVSYFLVRFIFADITELRVLFEVIFLTFTAKLMVFSVFYFAKFGDVGPNVIQVTLSSDNVFYSLLLLFSLSVYFYSSNFKLRIFFGIITLLSTFMIIFTFGREIWVLAGFSLLLFYPFVEKKYRSRILRTTILTVVIVMITASAFYPSLFDYMSYNLRTFSLDLEPVEGEVSGSVRTIEWINVGNLLWDKHAIIQGRGMGATWRDIYIPLYKQHDPFSYPTDEVEHGFTHMISSMLLLKVGLLGSSIFWFSLLYSWLKNLSVASEIKNFDRYTLLSLLIGCIPVFAKLTLVRIALLGGIILGLVSTYFILKDECPEAFGSER